jgi:tight adherence protein C
VVYRCLEIGTPIVLAAIPLVLMGTGRQVALILAGFGGAVGFFLPGLVLDQQIATRKKLIRNGLPDALDLLIICVEAGSSLDQAISKARDELVISHPALAEELDLVTTAIKAGRPRLEALRDFAERTKVDDVRSLVAILVQTDRFGTSVARALRTHAEVARTKRRQRAEEKAQKIGVKLVFPLVFCLFPAFYVVTLGPAAIQYIRVFRADIVPSTAQQP